ncbi:ALK and LTK ligand 2b [Heptranchias perlo]|uniref:ALK and LTK ligand 2b n=1 Tax=Heptranchias perlo TaxID=212740 RepID=UPI003559BBB5
MNGLRSPLFFGLVLLIITAGYCKERTDFTELQDSKTLLNLMLEIINQLQKHHEEETNDVNYFPQRVASTFDSQELPDYDVDHKEERVEIVPRDLRKMKDKFLKHLTGPLYFSPRCNKHFHRVYHNTRDCTIPAYYKRCARLLTRLAVSPMCVKG